MLVYHFAPSKEIGARRITACAKDLAEHGLPVTVVSAFAHEPPPATAIPAGVQAVWVPQKPPRILKSFAALKQFLKRLLPWRAKATTIDGVAAEAANNGIDEKVNVMLPLRIASIVDLEKRWSYDAFRAGVRLGRKIRPAAVMTSGPPMSNMIAATWTAKRLHVPLILDLRDPWITGSKWEVYANQSMEAHFGRFLERLAFKRATLITTATEGMANDLRTRFPMYEKKIFVVRNGFDGDPAPAQTSTNHRLNILFAGELYVSRNPFPFLEAVARLLALPNVDASRVRVTLVGRCDDEMRKKLEAWVQSKQLESVVQILKPVPFETIKRMTEESTVLLNLAQEASVMVPAKAYEHAASGREVLLISERDTDVFRMFENIPGMSCIDTNDAGGLDAALLDFYRRHVVAGTASPPTGNAIEGFSRNSQQEVFRRLLAQCGVMRTD